jgi:hypothetical protein
MPRSCPVCSCTACCLLQVTLPDPEVAGVSQPVPSSLNHYMLLVAAVLETLACCRSSDTTLQLLRSSRSLETRTLSSLTIFAWWLLW